jgi:lipoyl(octanoyl) transferase
LTRTPSSPWAGRSLDIRRLGRIAYQPALDLQVKLVGERQSGTISDTLLLLEHEPVFTLGRNAKSAHLLRSPAELERLGYAVHEVGRGGDVTYHGPGQIVGYPILDLAPERCDVRRYVRDLEEVMIRTCADYGVAAARIEGLTGAWVGSAKIGAIGVRIARWVTSHGFAFNVNTDLAAFSLIVPCGITGKAVTSLAQLLGRSLDLAETASAIERSFLTVFGYAGPGRAAR